MSGSCTVVAGMEGGFGEEGWGQQHTIVAG